MALIIDDLSFSNDFFQDVKTYNKDKGVCVDLWASEESEDFDFLDDHEEENEGLEIDDDSSDFDDMLTISDEGEWP